MFKKLLGSLGLGAKATPQRSAPAGPYAQPHANVIYHLLFCDDPALFAPAPGEVPMPWQKLVTQDTSDAKAVAAIAADENEESRIRVLAFNWLRTHGHAVEKGTLLGVIVEVPLERGLDVLAAYPDARVRYINQTGKMSLFECVTGPMDATVRLLLGAAQKAVSQIGPWEKPRLPAPRAGNVRLTFLVSDGLYFGEGPFSILEREPMAAPILRHAGELLKLVVAEAT